MATYDVDPDITKAHTLPSSVYRSRAVYDQMIERILAPSWQFIGDTNVVSTPRAVFPVTFLPGSVDEPLLLTRDDDDVMHCISNVCTHRGTLVCEGAGHCATLRCRYHGRRFELDGRFKSMPEFDAAADFPSDSDHLRPITHHALGPLLFAAIEPAVDFETFIAPVRARIGWLPLDRLRFDPNRSRDYHVNAHWALYCDNYLEGFHIPYVHDSLNAVLDYGEYAEELFDWGTLQLGIAGDDEHTFDLPPDSPDKGKRIAAYYFWMYPNTMINVYPWGISMNVVKPLDVNRTRVSFLTYVMDESKLDQGAGSGLDRVEREDEAVVEAVQQGMQSRVYGRGRFSPTRERGVHHFHRMIAAALNATP